MQKSLFHDNDQTTVPSREDVWLRNLTFLFMLGFLVYHWFAFPPVVWRVGLVILSLIGLSMHIEKYKLQKVEIAMLTFVAINIVYFFASFLWQKPEFTNFGNVLCATLPMLLFYVLSVRGAMTIRSLNVFLLLSIVFGIFYFLHAENELVRKTIYGEAGDFTVNASTIFLVIMPLVFFSKNKIMNFGVMAVSIFFILYGAKRGNIVSVTIPIYLLVRMNMKRPSSLAGHFFVFGAILALSYLAYYTAMESDYLLGRFEKTMEGDSSGRDEIYAAAFNVWLNSESFQNLILGHGTDATTYLIGIRAHNDWFEILVDFGLFGVVIYLTYFVQLFKVTWKNKNDKQIFYVLLSSLFIWFSKSFYSMGITESLFSYLSLAIGTALGMIEHKKQLNIIRNR